MKKKLILLPLTFISLSMLTGCNRNANVLTIWVDSKIVDLTKEQVNRFLTENPDCKYTYRVDTVSEQTAATQMIVDVESGADLYIFAQDQFSRLIAAGALASLPTNEDESKNIEKNVRERNIDWTTSAALHTDSSGKERMYAYPVTSDNGYILYYDKSVFTDEKAVESVDKILAKCKAESTATKKKYFGVSHKDGFWYSAGFFFSREINESIVGEPICKSEWTVNYDGSFKDKVDTFDSDNGLIAAKAIKQVYTNDYWLDSHNAGDLGAGGALAVISGTWDYGTAKEKLGDNLGVTTLPQFKVNDKTYKMGSFKGCKLLGVKPHSDINKSYWCAKLASYLTDEKCQLERFEKGWGPSNIEASQTKEVLEDKAIIAINEQNNKYAVVQGNYPDKWFKFGEQKIVATIKEKGAGLDDAALRNILHGYKSQIDELAPDK